MGRAVTVQRSAAGTSTWIVDADAEIVGFYCNTSSTLSRDSATTSANVQAPVTGFDLNIVALSFSASRGAPLGTKIPVFKDERVFVNLSAAGSAVIYIEP